MENKILLINRCDYLPEAFCKEFFKGSELIDNYILKYKDREYELVKCEPVGMILQRDIEMYKLIECGG